MADPATTHVIEIESGVGEPAFIPLVLGTELSPISVGRKGMWRLDGERVLDVHAFVYFDGASLFLQSADERTPATVDGYDVGKAWTELHAPCRIEVGGTRLRYRSLVVDAPESQGATLAMAQPPVPPREALISPQTQVSPGTPRGRGAEAAPPTQQYTKPARPFAPGALVAQNDDESTRVAPLESTGARPLMVMTGGHHALSAPRPAAGRPVEDDLSAGAARGHSRPLNDQLPSVQIHGSGGYPGAGPQPHGVPPGMMPPGMMGPGGYPPGPEGYGAPPGHGYGMPEGGGMPMGMPPGYGAMPPHGAGPPPQEGGKGGLLSDPSQRKKLLALGVILLGGAYVLLMDDDPPARAKKQPLRDGGPDAAMVASASASASGSPSAAAMATPPPSAQASPCPPGFHPQGDVVSGQPVTCVPAAEATTDEADGGATAVPSASATEAAPPVATAAATPSRPSSGKTKTLERQAVDYVAAGEYGKAIGIYEKLAEQYPDNKVYSEALRILRTKMDAGVP